MLSGGAATRALYARLKLENPVGPSPRCSALSVADRKAPRGIAERPRGQHTSLFLELFLGLARARTASDG